MLLTVWLVFPLQALVVDNAAVNDTAPGNGAPWFNVGQGGGASAVYLKNGWVIGARHVFGGSTSQQVSFNGMTYSSGTVFVLKNPDNSNSDVVLFNIGTSHPTPLTEIGITSTTPTTLTNLTMIGYGQRRSGVLTGINHAGGTANGYVWDGLGGVNKTWGTNRGNAIVNPVAVPGNNVFEGFATRFTANGSSGEAQATVGDSGGGVFSKPIGSPWLLAGTMNAIAGFNGQTSNTSAEGNLTYVADMVTYSDQINAKLDSGIAAPMLTSVSPGIVAVSNDLQTLTFSGSNFVSGAKLQVANAAQPLNFSDTANTAAFVSNTTLTVSVLASSPQTWKFRVVNPDGQPSAAVTVTIFIQTFANWLTGYPSLTGDDALATADPDFDGLLNLQEYAFGSDPTLSSRVGGPIIGIDAVASQTYLTLTYQKDTSKTDITYQAQTSTDLTSPWTNLGDTFQNSNGTLQMRKASVLLDGTTNFLRIQIVK